MATVSQKISLTGITSRGTISVFDTLDNPAVTTTQGTDTTPVVTQTYWARVFIPVNTTITGLSLLNGSAVAGNVIGALADFQGNIVATTASTAQSGTAAYQQVPLVTAYRAIGPGLYFIGWQFNNTSARFRTHILGNATAFAQTGQTFGTFTSFTSPNSFTTATGAISSTY